MKLKTPYQVVMAAALAALANASHAVPPGDPYYDMKSFPGAMCQPQQGAQAVDIQTFKDIVINTNLATRTVTCPIVRDNFTNATHPIGVEVGVASSGGKALTCTLFSYGPNGSPLVGSISASTSSATPVRLGLFLSPPVFQAPDGYYSVQCQLPQWGKVFSYLLDEMGDTDIDGPAGPSIPWPPLPRHL